MNVIQILGCVNDVPTMFDGQWVVEYDPGRDAEHDCEWIPVHLVTTDDITKATRYSTKQAMEVYLAVDPRHPVRTSDGKPNRPLTAFTVVLSSEEE